MNQRVNLLSDCSTQSKDGVRCFLCSFLGNTKKQITALIKLKINKKIDFSRYQSRQGDLFTLR